MQGEISDKTNDFLIREDYAHSANSLFHFMGESKYLLSALKRKALCPRYCEEDISYLHIHNDGMDYKRALVLQKCFCDIPLQNIARKFLVYPTKNNKFDAEQERETLKECSHTDLYGRYALAFSKQWGEENKVQPIHYMSLKGGIVTRFSNMINEALLKDDFSDIISDWLLNWICLFKPLRGTMRHRLIMEDDRKIECEFFKNFHDEHEWRFIPFDISINGQLFDCLITNEEIIRSDDIILSMNNAIEEERCDKMWLSFNYDDIRYIIVPDNFGRREVVEFVQSLPREMFAEEIQRAMLISKILVLDEIKRDF